MDTETRLKNLLKEIDEEIDTDAISTESELVADIGLSSVAILYMAVAIENEFGIDLSKADMEQIKTVGDVIEAIESV